MTDQPDQTLHFVVTKDWLLETINSLGSGYIIHLVYQIETIEPAVLRAIENRVLGEGDFGEIIHKKEAEWHRKAIGEIFTINNFESFYRFDLRLLEVGPFVRDGLVKPESTYLCYFYRESG